MKFQFDSSHPSRLWLCFFAALIVIASTIVMVPSFEAASADFYATYTHGVLHVAIPYRWPRAGTGQLIMEVLNPEDEVLGRTQRTVEVNEGKGSWVEDIKLDKPLPLEELVWDRMRYRFEYSGHAEESVEGTESIAQIIRTPVVHILGQQSYLTGGQAAIRVIVTDSKNQVIAGPGSVRIELFGAKLKPRVLFSGGLNHRGTTEAQFQFPADLVGNYNLRYVADTPIGTTEFTQSVKLEDKVAILLTTEKPIYQPGQTIHVRALALDRSDHEAAGNHKLTFEVEDSRGNKVFKKATQTDKFGIASAEFGLADEVNLGTYHLRALMGEADSAPTNTAEIALNVERYVLPKFKVAVELKGTDHKTTRGYRPGDHVTGVVHANYFFGKAVDGAEITVKASSMDVSSFEISALQGKTDGDGAYHFDLVLPAYFAGRPLNQGSARVLIEATVKDSAGHAETRGEPITVSESPLLITAVPEGGTLVPNLENQIFVLASYPDGKPASAALKVRMPGNAEQSVKTDDGGVTVVRVNAGTGPQKLEVDAEDKEGNHVSSTVQLETRAGGDQILLRTERALYRAGDRIHLRVLSTRQHGTAYVDIVKEGQTVLTRDLDIENGRAELSLVATPEMAGTVDFNAYLFGRDARPVGDHRLIFVQPADELKIEARAENAVYRPGEDARVRFHVTNSRGQGVQAALGLQVVDEAVFALAEKQPGFAKVFFYLEQEVMKPRYEIHSIGMPDIVEPVEKPQEEQQDRAARALFSATELVSSNKFETEFGRTVPQTRYADYWQRYYKRFLTEARQVSENLNRAYTKAPDTDDLVKLMEKVAPVRDVWGTTLRLERISWGAKNRYYIIRSAGPDKRFQSGDDLAAYVYFHRRKVVDRPSSGKSVIDVNVAQGEYASERTAEIHGTAVDQLGAALEGAPVQITNLSARRSSWAQVDGEGRFTFRNVRPGEYEVVVSTPTERISTKVKLEAGDRATLAAFLRHEPTGDIVTVNSYYYDDWGPRKAARAGVGEGVAGGIPFTDPPITMASPQPPMPHARREMVEAEAGAELRAPLLVANSAILTKDEPTKPHVRSYFPEALYINPEIITDKNGQASISIPLADSITTWRMALVASTQHGALGSATSSLKVFQDFFVDLDLPVTLTQGDLVSIPVAVYNYSGSHGDVDLKLQADDWFSLVDDVAEKKVAVDSARVAGSQFTLQARRIGKYKLTLSASMDGQNSRADIVVREIEVVPNGRERSMVFNGVLESSARHELNFPESSIPDASKIYVRLYPGPLSQVIEGMDSILEMPHGCFEQTSSSNYPNVLALDYMKRTRKLTPEVHAKAEGYIALGYQRLVTFEVKGGGFSLFGNAPASKYLTAYGLTEFSDMSKVHNVDSRLIQRTQQWLADQQKADGSWTSDGDYYYFEDPSGRGNVNAIRTTAYIAWSLENTGYHGPAVDKARKFLEQAIRAKLDAYTLAVLANFAVDYGKDREFTRETMQALLDGRTEKNQQVWWTTGQTSFYSTGTTASVETTGLAVQALLKWGQDAATVRKAIAFIASKKDSRGAWGSTQATIMALRALLLATEKGAADVRGTLQVLLNGKPVEKLELTPENNDLLHQFVFKGVDAKDDAKEEGNTVEIRFAGKGELAYQVVGSYFLPWGKEPENEPLSIDVAYDRTRLSQDDIATATATVTNNLPKSANMVMVDLGIPPGFDLLSEDLQAYQEKSAGKKSGRLEKFTLTATQAILYFDSIASGDTVTLRFRLRAKYPIRARTFQSRVYEYYDPDVSSLARPIELKVNSK